MHLNSTEQVNCLRGLTTSCSSFFLHGHARQTRCDEHRLKWHLWTIFFLLVLSGSLEAVEQTVKPLPISYICIEAETGMVLLEDNADLIRPPASMVKMMQMLLVEEGVRAGKWTYEMAITVSKRAQSMGGTKVYLKEGETWPLETLMITIAVVSANDASAAVAEGLWGSIENCVIAMNERAQELGMANTFFYSVNGLPPSDGVSFDRTTAREMAVLGRALLAYPNVLKWTSMREFSLRPNDKPRPSTNKLLERFPGCDGLKTGYIRAAGFCLTATAKRDDIRLLAVVMGSDQNGRFTHTQNILEQGFSMVQRVQPVVAGARLGKPIPVQKGVEPEVCMLAKESISAIVRKDDLPRLALEITSPVTLKAPLEAGTEIGYAKLVLDNKELGRCDLLLDRSIEKQTIKDYGFGCMGRRE